MIVAGLAHGINMFDFPAYLGDEGIYVSQAWAVVELGALSPYTYWYDHAPLGWIQLAAWSVLTGGFSTFGTAIDSGRVLMLVIQIVSTFVLYRIARNVSGSVVVAAFVSLAFALSAYGIYSHRRVLLDNIATLWMLLGILPLVSGRLTLTKVWISALAISVSALSKELTVFLVPVLVYLVHYRADEVLRRFATIGWAAIVGCVGSTYFLFAALKGELLPAGASGRAGLSERVSLLDTLRWQASRGDDGGVFSPDSSFWTMAEAWATSDPLLTVAGTTAALASVLLIKRWRLAGIMGLATLSLWVFLARGGVVLGFYLVPLLPLLALNLGLVLGHCAEALKTYLRKRGYEAATTVARSALFVAMGLCLALTARGYASVDLDVVLDRPGARGDPFKLWNSELALAQRQTVDWIEANLPTDSAMIIDQDMYTDLHDGAASFDYAHYHRTASLDPEIRDGVFSDNWRSIDYVVTHPGMLEELDEESLEPVESAVENSTLITRFDTGGIPIEVRRVDKPEEWETWEAYTDRFIEDGRVVDPKRNRLTSSEGQAYAMLRAVYMNDRGTFDEVWNWSEKNLRRDDGLLAWRWGERPDGSSGVLDIDSAADADTDAALALLFAAKRWDEPEYEKEALEILDGIWEEETAFVDGERVILAGPWARDAGASRVVVNPSYFAPYAYRVFAEADPERPWEELADSSYDVLERIRASSEFGGEAGLAPDWVALDTRSGGLLPAHEFGPRSAEFSYDASRVPWRISLDYLWFEEDRARETLESLDLPRRELERSGRLFAAYEPDGDPAADFESLSMYAGVVPGLLVVDEELAQRVHAEEISGRYTDGPGGAYWGDDPDNYYDQNMAAFATATMDGSMTNLYAEK